MSDFIKRKNCEKLKQIEFFFKESSFIRKTLHNTLQKHKNPTKMFEKWFQNFKIACLSLPSKNRVTDLKIGTLVKIFQHVGLRDLLSLADSNVYLKRAAECVFVQRYGMKKLWLYKVRAYEYRNYSVYSKLLVEDFKTSLQLLRSFGHLISHLEIGESEDASELCEMHQIMYKYLFSYVNEYCSMHLTDISFVMIPKGAMEMLKKPFYRAKTVNLFGCHFGEKMTSFETLFPNVLCLKLDFNEAADPSIIEEHWQRMKHLEVNIDKNNFKRENIEEVLCLNPQLRRLKISSGWSAEFLEDIRIFLQFIEVLEFGRLFDGFSDFGGKPIHFEGVKKLKISLPSTKYNHFPKIPLSFVQLDVCTLETDLELNDEFYKFVGKHQSISKLNICTPSQTSETTEEEEHQFQFRKEIAFLTDINLSRYTFSLKDAVQLVHDFKLATKLTFRIDDLDHFEDLLHELSGDWIIEKESNTIGKKKCIEMTRRPAESSFEYIRQFFES